MKDYYAVVEGRYCYKLMIMSLDDIPEGSVETNWFLYHDGDPSPVVWAPVENPEINYACQLIAEFNQNRSVDGIYEINVQTNSCTVNKLSNVYTVVQEET